MGKWISVEDEMPDLRVCCLVTCEEWDWRYKIGYRDRGPNFFDEHWRDSWNHSWQNPWWDVITHWMPAPETPETKND